MASQPRRRQIVFGGTGIEGSSESDSAGTEDWVAGGTGWEGRDAGKFKMLPLGEMDFAGGGMISDGEGGSGLVTSSTMECFPVVQGGIERNSSNVKNRGLQHFQPESRSQPMFDRFRRAIKRGCPDTFLPFMKYWRPGMEDAIFFGIGEILPATFMDTSLSHIMRK